MSALERQAGSLMMVSAMLVDFSAFIQYADAQLLIIQTKNNNSKTNKKALKKNSIRLVLQLDTYIAGRIFVYRTTLKYYSDL